MTDIATDAGRGRFEGSGHTGLSFPGTPRPGVGARRTDVSHGVAVSPASSYAMIAYNAENPAIIMAGVSMECGAVASTTVMSRGTTATAVQNSRRV